jgi:hypothetical protein
MPSTPPPLQTDWPRRLARLDNALSIRIQAAYRRYHAAMRAAADRAIADAAAGQAEGVFGDTRAQAAARRLQESIEREMAAFTPLIEREARRGVTEGIALGTRAADAMIATQYAGTIGTASAGQIAQLVGIVDSPAFQTSLQRFAPAAGQRAADILIAGVTRGMGPNAIARLLVRYIDNTPRAWAQTTARTAQLTAYRRASHETYRANADVVNGWVWFADLSPRTCLSCIAQHGSFHTNDEELNDHHRGRCVALPHVRGTRWTEDVQAGEDWFAAQPARTQREMMGPTLYDAYRAGDVDWGRMSVPYQDAVYGTLLRRATLDELGLGRVK